MYKEMMVVNTGGRKRQTKKWQGAEDGRREGRVRVT
jgi:hypothetical protein